MENVINSQMVTNQIVIIDKETEQLTALEYIIPGVNSTGNQDTTGNSATTTKFENPIELGGIEFDGSLDLDLPGVNISGTQNTTGSAATLTTSRKIGDVSFDGSEDINLPGVNTIGNQNTTGSAATLTTVREIGGVEFDGSENIDLPGVNTTGNQNTTGSAATLTTPRDIGGVEFNGSANINLPGVNITGNQNTSGTADTLSRTLKVHTGGTGSTSFTQNGVLIGNGTNPVSAVDLSNKGRIIVGTETNIPTTLGLGNNNQILMVDTTVSTGMKWGEFQGFSGIDVKNSVRATTTTNGNLTTAFANDEVIDGVTLKTEDRILIKDQSNKVDNGIYSVNAIGAPSRTSDFDSGQEVTHGAFTFVEEGTINADCGFVLTTDKPADGVIDIGTDELDFSQFSRAGIISAGNALTKDGSIFHVNVDNSSIEINSDQLRVKALGITNAMIANNSIDLTAKVTNVLPIGKVGLSQSGEASIANGDYILFLDGGANGTPAKENIADVATLFAGTGLTSSNSVIAVDASQAITALTGGDLSIYDDNNNADVSLSIGTSATEALVIQVLNGSSNKTAESVSFITKTASTDADVGKMDFIIDEQQKLEINDSGVAITGSITCYEDTNNADVSLSMGTSATEALVIQVLNGSSNKTAESVSFTTKTASGTSNHGKMDFLVDEQQILEINDSGINLATSKNVSVNNVNILADSSGTLTLSNIDALDSTTETTIETAIDTLINLTSIGASGVSTVVNGNLDVAEGVDVTGSITCSVDLNIEGDIDMATGKKITWVDNNQYISGDATSITIEADDEFVLNCDTSATFNSPTTIFTNDANADLTIKSSKTSDGEAHLTLISDNANDLGDGFQFKVINGVLTLSSDHNSSGVYGETLLTITGNDAESNRTVAVSGNLDVSSGVDVTGNLTISAKLIMNDNTAGKILIGDGTSYEEQALSGDATLASDGSLTLAANQTNITKIGTAADQEYITFGTANEVNIHINNSEKLSVTSSGVDVTGTLTSSGTVNGLYVKSGGTNFDNSILLRENDLSFSGTLATAENNIGIGNDVFDALTSGDNNVGIGVEALKNNNEGSHNIAIGYKTLTGGDGEDPEPPTDLIACIGIGTNALANGSFIRHNIAIGFNALKNHYASSSSYSYNTVIGSYAMEKNVTGKFSVAVGGHSQQYVVPSNDSAYNTSIGYQSLKGTNGSSTGEKNVAIGAHAMINNTTGSENTAVGTSALNNNTAGVYNTAVGRSGGGGITIGDKNITIGFNAGYTGSNNLTTGSNNVLIGAETETTHSSSINQINIGKGVTGRINPVSGMHTNVVTLGNSDITHVFLSQDYGAKLFCTGIDSSSDSRIKTNIVDIDDSSALQYVRDIPCRYYTYLDTVRRGTAQTPGFIAQEVEAVFPLAVSTDTNCIPNEYRLLTNYTLVETTTPIDTENTTAGNYWKLTINDLTDLSTTNKYRIKVSNDTTFDLNNGNNVSRFITAIDGEQTSFLLKQQWTHIFLYGKEVTDFKTIDKAKIFTLHHSAIQQIDTTLTAEQVKIATLETELANEKAKVTTLENVISTLSVSHFRLEAEINTIKAHLGL